MRVFMCLDQKDGLLFNDRRQSRDREVVADIEKTIGHEEIGMSEYSAKLFEGHDNIVVTDDLKDCRNVFLEKDDIDLLDFDELIIYRWDKVYPADARLTFDYKSMTLKDVSVITGYSHDKIIKEVYVR